ncbi:hypothetical protein Tco_1076964 [Tanacetum coccineum]
MNVTKDPAPVADEFNAQDYATLVAHPFPFRKFPEEFLCLVGLSRHYTLDEESYSSFVDKDEEDMDIFALQIWTSLPSFTLRILLSTQVEQGDSAGGGDGQDTVIQPVTATTNTVVEDVIPLQPRRQRKRKTIVFDASGPLHPPKRLREDHRTPNRASVGGKSRSAVQRLLAGAVQNAEVRGEPLPTLPFVTSSVSAMPERENEDHSHHSGANIAEAEVDSFARPSVPILPESMTNVSRLDDRRVCREMVDEFAPLKFFVFVRGMEHDQLFTESNVGAARQMSLSAEAEAAKASHLRAEASKFEAVEKSLQVVDLAASVKVREQEVADLGVVLERFQDEKMKVVNDKFDKLYTDFIEMALHLEERFYPHFLTTISGRMWLLTHGMELAIAKCLNSSEYLSAFRAAIGKAIEKGVQDGQAAGITHGKEGRVLADVAAYNPSAEVDYVFTLQQLQSVNFSLLAELKLNKDSSVETLMNILRLEETLAERLGLNESQPHVDQLMIPIIIHQAKLSLVLLPCTEGTSGTAPNTTTALSVTFAFVSSIPSILTDDYEVVHADG